MRIEFASNSFWRVWGLNAHRKWIPCERALRLSTLALEGCISLLTKFDCLVSMSKTFHVIDVECLDWKHCTLMVMGTGNNVQL